MAFIKEFFMGVTVNFFLVVLTFLNNVIITRYLGPENRGKYQLIMNLVILLLLVFGEGVKKRNTIESAKDNKIISFLITNTLKLIFVFALVTIPLVAVTNNYILPNISFILLLLAGSISFFNIIWESNQAILLGLRRIFLYNILFLIPVVVVLLLNIAGIFFFQIGLEGIIQNILIASLLTLILSFYFLKEDIFKSKKSTFSEPSKKLIYKSTFSAIMMYVTLRSDIFLINYFWDSASTGIFAVAMLFSEVSQKVPNIVGPLIITRVSGDKTLSSAFGTVKAFRIIFLFNILLLLSLFLFGEQLILILFKEEFLPSYTIVLYLLPAIFVIGLGGILHSFFIGKEYPRALIIINTITAISNLSLNFILIPSFGITGAAITASISYTFWFISLIILFIKKTGLPLNTLFRLKKEDFDLIIKSFMQSKN